MRPPMNHTPQQCRRHSGLPACWPVVFSQHILIVAPTADEALIHEAFGVVAQMPVAAEVGSGDERDELGSG